jgi:hypothetical protein
VFSLFTKAIMVAALAGSIYCTWRLHQQAGWGPAVRYAVAAMIVAWTPVEIAGKWGILQQPWLLLRPDALAVFFGGLGLGTWALWRAQRRSRQAVVRVPEGAVDEPVGATHGVAPTALA